MVSFGLTLGKKKSIRSENQFGLVLFGRKWNKVLFHFCPDTESPYRKAWTQKSTVTYSVRTGLAQRPNSINGCGQNTKKNTFVFTYMEKKKPNM